MIREILKEAADLFKKLEEAEYAEKLTKSYEVGKNNAVELPFAPGDTVYQYGIGDHEFSEYRVEAENRLHWCRTRYRWADQDDIETLALTKAEAATKFAVWLGTASQEDKDEAAKGIAESLDYHRKNLADYELISAAIGR